MTPRAKIWYDPPHERGLRWNRQAGYAWQCSCNPRARGRNSFNRFTDRIRRTLDVHPWQRCMDAVERHFCTHHRRTGD